MLRRVLHEMEFSRCQFLDLRKHFDTLVDMVASLCQRGSKVFYTTYSRNLGERQRQMDYILSCAIHSQESFCSSNVHIYFGSRTGQLYTYHLLPSTLEQRERTLQDEIGLPNHLTFCSSLQFSLELWSLWLDET